MAAVCSTLQLGKLPFKKMLTLSLPDKPKHTHVLARQLVPLGGPRCMRAHSPPVLPRCNRKSTLCGGACDTQPLQCTGVLPSVL